MTDQDPIDETARLILLENPDIAFGYFASALVQHHVVTVSQCREYYAKYKGWSGPRKLESTHDVESGEPLAG